MTSRGQWAQHVSPLGPKRSRSVSGFRQEVSPSLRVHGARVCPVAERKIHVHWPQCSGNEAADHEDHAALVPSLLSHGFSTENSVRSSIVCHDSESNFELMRA